MWNRFLSLRKLLVHPTIHRWIDLAFLTLVASVLMEIFKPELTELTRAFVQRSASWPEVTVVLFFGLLSWLVALLLTRLGALDRGHFSLRRLAGFPPVWLSGAVGCAIVLSRQLQVLYQSLTGPITEIFPWLFMWTLPSLAGLTVGLSTERRRSSRRFSSLSNTRHDSDALRSWLAEEKPITTPVDDKFGVSLIAQRIAAALRAAQIQTVGIVGPYGTGKTSLLNLTEFYLQERLENATAGTFVGEMIVCRVDGWGRMKGSTAERVLTMTLDQVAGMVDCSSVLSLPANYRRAIEGMRWSGGAILSALLEASPEPVVKLKKLDRIITAGGLRLVIMLEDLDRNTADEIIRDEIPALLDRLRGMRSISFVLAIGTEHLYSDILIRICDHVEAIA